MRRIFLNVLIQFAGNLKFFKMPRPECSLELVVGNALEKHRRGILDVVDGAEICTSQLPFETTRTMVAFPQTTGPGTGIGKAIFLESLLKHLKSFERRLFKVECKT